MSRLLFLPMVLSLLAGAVSVHGDNWTQFRGTQAGKLSKISHPLEWSKDINMAWSVPMEGSGWSSPIVVGDRIFLSSAESDDASKPKGMSAGVASMRSFRSAKPSNHRYVVSCLNLRDGELVWRKVVSESVPSVIHPSNTYATESPATDGQHLFVFFATTGTLTSWDFDGNELWRRELGAYKAGNGFGTGSSLVLAGDHLVVQDDNDEDSFVVAFHKDTGQQIWRNERRKGTSWSTPIVWQTDSEQELVTCGSDVVTSYNPKDGSVNWKLTGMKSGFSGSPAVGADQIFFGTSGPSSAGPLIAIKAGIKGDIPLDSKFKHANAAWSRIRSGPGMASPIVSQGLLYISSSGGILNCYDTKNGERVFRTRVPNMGTVVASLWADEQRVLLLDENGNTHVVKAGREFSVERTNTIEDLFWSTPAIAGDTLLVRGVENLYCVRER